MKSDINNWIVRQFKDVRSRRLGARVWLMSDLNAGYIAIPKVVSSGIRNAIRDRESHRLSEGGPALDRKSFQRRLEKKITVYAKPVDLRALREQIFLFAFVRNPLTRLYSCFRDKVVNAANRHETCTLAPYGIHFGMTFDEFIERVSAIPDKRSDQHFRSQHTFLTHEGEIMPHHLGKFEQFASDWQPIHERFGLECPGKTRRVSGPPLSLTDLPISPTGVELAMERYEHDFTLFGYEKEARALLDALKKSGRGD